MITQVLHGPGRVSDVHFGLATLHDLVGVTAGAKPGMILSRSLSAGGLRMACRVVQCTAATRYASRISRAACPRSPTHGMLTGGGPSV